MGQCSIVPTKQLRTVNMPKQLNLTEEDVAQIKAQFSTLDQNGDGMITVAEVRQALNKAGQDYTVKDVQKRVKKADRNGDGRVVWQEFLEMMGEHFHKSASREGVKIIESKDATVEEYDEAMHAFRMFDKNSDGKIDIEELKVAMKELDLESDSAKVEQLLKDLDKNGDGTIDYVEFGRLLGI